MRAIWPVKTGIICAFSGVSAAIRSPSSSISSGYSLPVATAGG
jgi:hypothetical protein